MANEPKKLTHKVRNPNNMSTWWDIWSAEISADGNSYVIKPNLHWNFEGISLEGANFENTYPEGTENCLAKFNSNGTIINGPAIDPSEGNSTTFLNEKGQWVSQYMELPLYSVFDANTNHNVILIADNNATERGVVKAPAILTSNPGDLPKTYDYDTNLNTVWGYYSEKRNNEIIYKTGWHQITTEQIQNNAITEDKMVDGAVTHNKLGGKASQMINTKLLGLIISDTTPRMYDENDTELQNIINAKAYKHQLEDPEWEPGENWPYDELDWLLNDWDYEHLGLWIQV